MTAIRDYLRQIAGYLILSVLVENLVAKKEYGPYIRLFLNLLLVLLFVSPILSISAERVGQTWLEAGAFFSEGTYLEADLQKLNDKQTTLEVSAQKKILEQQIRDLLKKRECFLEDLSLETDSSGTIIQIEVTVSEIKTNEKEEYLFAHASSNYTVFNQKLDPYLSNFANKNITDTKYITLIKNALKYSKKSIFEIL